MDEPTEDSYRLSPIIANRFVSIVRIFYTVLLVLGGLFLVLYYSVMPKLAASGHGTFSVLSLQSLVLVFSFLLLLVSRLLYYRSPKWLWLGVPSVLLPIGFVLWAVFPLHDLWESEDHAAPKQYPVQMVPNASALEIPLDLPLLDKRARSREQIEYVYALAGEVMVKLYGGAHDPVTRTVSWISEPGTYGPAKEFSGALTTRLMSIEPLHIEHGEVTRYILFTETAPTEIYHSLGAVLGAAVVTKKDERWYITSANTSLAYGGSFGRFGDGPYLLQIGPHDPDDEDSYERAFLFPMGYCNNGYCISWKPIYAFVDGAVKEILQIDTGENNMGVGDTEPSVANDTRFVPISVPGKAYFDIAAVTTGTKLLSDRKTIVSADTVRRFTFNGVKYVPASSSPQVPTLAKEFEGSWVWRWSYDQPVTGLDPFFLTLNRTKEEGFLGEANFLTASWEASWNKANRVDMCGSCGIGYGEDNTATLTFIDGYGGGVGVTEVTYDPSTDTILWEITQPPRGEYYIPDKATLRRAQ